MTYAIKTAFWRDGKCVRLNSSTDIDRAVGQAIYHMRRNTNRADYVEVYDTSDADLLHAQVKRSPATGTIQIYDRSKDKLKVNRRAATPFFR